VVDRTLYWFKERQLMAHFPVAVGRADWETPPGRFRIISRRHKPTWHVPPAIQAEMRERGERVRTRILPGPDNPLGEYWLQLSAGDYGIHGTNAPWSVGKYATHGCIRLRPADVERLFHEVPDGTLVWVIYEPVKVAQLDDGRVLLQVNEDIYNRAQALRDDFAAAAGHAGLADHIDLDRAATVIENAWGIPVDVTRQVPAGGPS
jgi:L,D-transpeptidase ErfK/SrfK